MQQDAKVKVTSSPIERIDTSQNDQPEGYNPEQPITPREPEIQYDPTEFKKQTFHTNIVELPSKGLLYPEGHPLRAGKVEMKLMTTKEENILTTESYIKSGIVIDKFLQSMVVAPKFNFDDLLIGDKDALIIASRIYGHGEIYPVKVTTPSGKTESYDVDLTTLEHKELNETLFSSGENSFRYSYENKLGKYDIDFKLLTVRDQKEIDEKLGKKVKVSGAADTQVSTRLLQMITAVNGNSDPRFIRLFVEDEFLAPNSRAFRNYVGSIQPGINLEVELTDGDSGDSFRHTVTVGPSFFWPDL